MKTILAVCWGNIFRSPVAEVLINRKLSELNLSDSVSCISRGIQGQSGIPVPKYDRFCLYSEEYRLAEPTLREANIDINGHISKPVDSEVLQKADIIIALEDRVLNGRGGLRIFGDEIANKTIVCEISDPHETDMPNKYKIIIPDIIFMIEQVTPRLIDFLYDRETKEELDLRWTHRKLKEI